MNELEQQMKVLLATVFSFYLKSHYFHWNITGPNFPQYHKFLEDLYDDVHDSVDKIAEEIRTMGAYAPGSLTRYSSLTKIEDELNIPSPANMFNQLLSDNHIVIDLLKKARELSEANKAYGLINFLEERIDIHYKHDWMIRSITKQ